MAYLFYGPDTYSLIQELESEKQKLLKKNLVLAIEEFEVNSNSDDKLALLRLQEMFEAQSLFSSEKIIILRNFLTYSSKLALASAYLLKTLEEASIHNIFLIQLESFDRRLKFGKAIEKLAKVRLFEIPQGAALISWIKKVLKDEGYEIDPSALKLILQRIGEEYDLWQIKAELEKLMLYGDGSRTIGVKEVQEIIPTNLNHDVFALTNAVAEGKVSEAVFVLQHLVSDTSSQKAQVIQVIGALASQIRSLLLVKDFEGPPADLAKTLGWKEGRVWINLKLASKFSTHKLRQLLSDLRAIDFRLKTSDEPAKLLLTLFIQKTRPIFPPQAWGGIKGEVEPRLV